MKISVFLFFFGLLNLVAGSTYSQNTKISLDMKDASIESVLNKIEEVSEFYFLFNHKLIDVDRKVDITAEEESIRDILGEIFPSEVSIIVSDRQIVLTPVRGSEELGVIIQQQTITGKVSDASTGELMPGVSVLVKGTTIGTITGADGKFSLPNVPPNSTLVFSFVGMKTQEVPVGNQTVIDISLLEVAVGLDEVVVTALGISREKRQLNYSIQQIDGDMLATTGNIDVSKGLQGKVAGVTIRQLSGAPGRTAKVTIRGSNSITGDNTPLYVVDGAPVDGSIALEISPNEIEDISVLKGVTAAALYGLRASNGVILISTKRGKSNVMNRPMVSLNTNYSFDRLSVYPETQKIYGQGVNGVFDPYGANSFGPKISEWGTYINQLGEEEVARAYDNVKDFFRTGGTHDSNLSISNRFDKGNYSVSVGYSGQSGIIPKTDFTRVASKFASDYDISEKITVSTLVNYSTSVTHSFNEEGGSSSVFYAAFGAPPSYNLKGKPIHVEGNPYQQINYRGQHDNIYWILENNGVKSQTSSLISSAAINYNPVNWLNFNYRFGLDESMVEGTEIYGFGSGKTGGFTVPPKGGRLTESISKKRSINSTFIASINHKLTDKLDFEILAGNEFYDYNYKSLSSTGNDFTIPSLHHLSNCSQITTNQYLGRNRSYAFFGNINMTYAKMLSLTITGRNDVVSNMPRNNRSFTYPSIGMGFIFTELIQNAGFLTFGKVRASYAEVGQAGSIYSTSTVYTRGGATRYAFPYGGINSFTLSNNLKSTDLVPENTKGWEFGANLIFFNNRINLDYTYYTSKSEGQIFSVPISATTGFASETRNAGEMANHGHEIVLNIKPVVTGNFSWDFTTNFAAFVNKVTKLAEGVDELQLGGTSYIAYVVAREGEHYPILKGYGFARDPSTGKIVVLDDPTSTNYGMPLRSASNNVIFGKADLDFEINFMNMIRYKNISLYAQIDWRQGGLIASGDSRLGKNYGTHYETQFRDDDYIEPDAVKGHYAPDGSLIIGGNNDIVIKRTYRYWRNVMDIIGEHNVYDGSFIRLREVKISYDLPVGILSKNKITSVSLFVIGRNLWLIKSGLPYYDPEMNSSSGNAIGSTYTGYPQISNLGFGLNLKF